MTKLELMALIGDIPLNIKKYHEMYQEMFFLQFWQRQAATCQCLKYDSYRVS